MAELLASDGWEVPGSLGAYLREALPEDYTVVAEPAVARCRTSLIVVGRRSLFIIHTLDDRPSAIYEPPSGTDRRSRCEESLRHFIAGDFPGLTIPIHEIITLRDWATDPPVWSVVGNAVIQEQPLSEAIGVLDAEPAESADSQPAPWTGDDQRKAFAVSLRERRLTVSQRTSRPFIFPGAGALRGGTRVWTIADAAAHMDRHPADGMQHLRDGALAAWLDDEGAPDVARLAREVVGEPSTDMRVALEEFLITSGLVERPRQEVQPAAVDLGRVTQGGKASRALQVRQVRGRGYLYGTATPDRPWLDVQPRYFRGPRTELVVTADTTGLVVGAKPHLADVWISSNAGEAPVAIPIAVRVVAAPSPLNRRLLRPLAGLLVAGLCGALIGLLWHLARVPRPVWLPEPALGRLPWVSLLGGVWALAGLLRGLRQPPAWPIGLALGRWLTRASIWSGLLALLAVGLVAALGGGRAGSVTLPDLSRLAVAVIAAGFGFVPATLGELLKAWREGLPGYVQGRSSRRALLVGGAAITLLVVMLLAPRML